MDIVIRELTGPDLAKGFLEALASLAEVKLSQTDALNVFQKRLRDGIHTYIALVEGVVVGTASLFIEQKFIHSGGRVGHIEDVAVRKDLQLKGLGTRLVEHATEEARRQGCYKVLLNCFEDRVGFYQRLGYRRQDVGMRIDW